MTLPRPSERSARGASSAVRDILRHARRPGIISLAGGVPAPETFPHDIVVDATDRALAAGTGPLQYGLTAGEESTRQALAPWTGTDPAPAADDIVVTTGSQQGIELVSRTYLDPGDVVVVAASDYLGALQVFRSHDATLHAIAIDECGLDVEQLAADLSRGLRPKLVYTVPNHHNPTGATLSTARADVLAGLAEHYGFLIVEDDPYRELGAGPPIVIGPGSPNVVRLRSVSKILSPGLRCGWLVAGPEVVDAAIIAKQSIDLHTSTLSQAVAAVAVSDLRFPAHLERTRHHYDIRRHALVDALRRQVPQLCFREPAGGMFVWASGFRVDTAALLPRALDAGIAFVPGAVFDPDSHPSDRIRLSYATASPDDLARAVSVLAELLKSPN